MKPISTRKRVLLNRRSTTVLILDDDPKIRGILKFFLAEFKYPIVKLQTSKAPHMNFATMSKRANLIIMDWKLGKRQPSFSHTDFAGHKAALDCHRRFGLSSAERKYQSHEYFQWITKPYDKNQLDLEIQRALYSHSRSRE